MHRRPTKIYCILSRARALLLRLSSAGFIYLLLHGEFLVALITILTCESKPAKWQDIIQLNSFTCIKLRDNKNALNRRKKKGQTKKKEGTRKLSSPCSSRAGRGLSNKMKYNADKRVCVYFIYIPYIYDMIYLLLCGKTLSVLWALGSVWFVPIVFQQNIHFWGLIKCAYFMHKYKK